RVARRVGTPLSNVIGQSRTPGQRQDVPIASRQSRVGRRGGVKPWPSVDLPLRVVRRPQALSLLVQEGRRSATIVFVGHRVDGCMAGSFVLVGPVATMLLC